MVSRAPRSPERADPRGPAAGDLAILEVGCGTGHNLAMLWRFGTVDALELDSEARALAEQRLGKPIMRSPLPDLTDVPNVITTSSARST